MKTLNHNDNLGYELTLLKLGESLMYCDEQTYTKCAGGYVFTFAKGTMPPVFLPHPEQVDIDPSKYLDKPLPQLEPNKHIEIYKWLLGYGDFPLKKDGEGNFYWRKHLRDKLADIGMHYTFFNPLIDSDTLEKSKKSKVKKWQWIVSDEKNVLLTNYFYSDLESVKNSFPDRSLRRADWTEIEVEQ